MPLQTVNDSRDSPRRSPRKTNQLCFSPYSNLAYTAEPDKSVNLKQKLIKTVTERKPKKTLLELHYSVLKAAIDYHNDEEFYVEVRDTRLVEGILQFVEFGTYQQVVDHLDIFLQDIALAIVIGTDKDREENGEEVSDESEPSQSQEEQRKKRRRT